MIVRVNGIVAAVVTLCGLLVAAYIFGRSSRVLDRLCGRLALWRREELSGEAGTPLPRDDAGLDWAGEVEKAFWEMEDALCATYRTVAEAASRMSRSAVRMEHALSEGAPDAEVRSELASLREQIDEMHGELAKVRYEGEE